MEPSALQYLQQMLRHEPPEGASEAEQIQAFFQVLAEVMAAPRDLGNAIWAAALLSSLRGTLTTVEEWQQWGTAASWLMNDLLCHYEEPA